MRKRIVSAQEARELGLVHEVVPAGELMSRALELAHELNASPGLTNGWRRSEGADTRQN